MQKLLDVLNEQAAIINDDLHLPWQVIVNDVAVKVDAATRAEYDTREEAFAAAVALRDRLVEVIGEPRTHEEVHVLSRPDGPHYGDVTLTGYRGWVHVAWPPGVLGTVRSSDDDEGDEGRSKIIV